MENAICSKLNMQVMRTCFGEPPRADAGAVCLRLAWSRLASLEYRTHTYVRSLHAVCLRLAAGGRCGVRVGRLRGSCLRRTRSARATAGEVDLVENAHEGREQRLHAGAAAWAAITRPLSHCFCHAIAHQCAELLLLLLRRRAAAARWGLYVKSSVVCALLSSIEHTNMGGRLASVLVKCN